MNKQTRIAALGLTAGLVGGGLVGFAAGVPSLVGASSQPNAVQDDPATTDDTATTNDTATTDDTETTDTETTEPATTDTTDQDGDDTTDPDRKARFEDRLRERLQSLVDDGTLTSAQLDAVIAKLDESRPSGDLGGRGHGPGRGHGHGPFGRFGANLEAVATALGIDVDELRTELQSGKSIADIAGEHGVDVQTVIDAVIAELTTRLDEAVTNGRLTQEQRDDLVSDLTERITDMVNRALPSHD